MKLEINSVAELRELLDVMTDGTRTAVANTPAQSIEDLGGNRLFACTNGSGGFVCNLPQGHKGRHCAIGYNNGLMW